MGYAAEMEYDPELSSVKGKADGGIYPPQPHSPLFEDSPSISGLPCSQAEHPLVGQSCQASSPVLALDCCLRMLGAATMVLTM